MPKTDPENRFPLLMSVPYAQTIGKGVSSVVFVPSSCWLSIFGGKQNPQLTARGAEPGVDKSYPCPNQISLYKSFKTNGWA